MNSRVVWLLSLWAFVGCFHDRAASPDASSDSEVIARVDQSAPQDQIAPDTQDPPDQTADGQPPQDRGPLCACEPGASIPCGRCNAGTQTCLPDCTGLDECVEPPWVCSPANVRSCGNCNLGNQTCGPDCKWGACDDQSCAPGDKQPCPNNCGERTCEANCSWSSCSKDGQFISPSGKLCYSTNHCPNPPTDRCVNCWLMCDGDGNLQEDGWCAGSNCTACSPLNDQCW